MGLLVKIFSLRLIKIFLFLIDSSGFPTALKIACMPIITQHNTTLLLLPDTAIKRWSWMKSIGGPPLREGMWYPKHNQCSWSYNLSAAVSAKDNAMMMTTHIKKIHVVPYFSVHQQWSSGCHLVDLNPPTAAYLASKKLYAFSIVPTEVFVCGVH